MNNIIKSKSLVSISLSVAILLTCFPLCATPSNTLPVTLSTPVSLPIAEHKRTITQFLDELKVIQNRTFQLLQLGLDNPPRDLVSFQTNMNSINNDAASLRQKVLDYQRIIPDTTAQYRDVLLILNTLNYNKNALFALELLPQTTANVERALLLENFFQTRLEGIDAFNIIENIISGY